MLVNARNKALETGSRITISGTVSTNSGSVIQGEITAHTINFGSTRRAPSPPKPFQSARALYDFIPGPDDVHALGFKANDMIELEDRNSVDENGWLRGRIKGGNGQWGIVPLKYLE